MKFDHTHGAGLVWVTDGDLCSAEMVWVQKEPKVELVSLRYGQARVKYTADSFSKAAKDSNTKVSITLSGYAEEGSKIEHYRQQFSARTGVATLNFASDYTGTNFHVFATINDGTYSKRVFLGKVTGGI